MIGEKKSKRTSGKGKRFWELEAFPDTTKGDNHKKESAGTSQHVLPTMPQSEPVSEKELQVFWKKALSFYREGSSDTDAGVRSRNFLPALLAKFQDMRHVRHDYPLWLSQDGSEMTSVSDLIASAVESFASASDEARILKDNLARFEVILRSSVNVPVDEFQPAMSQALTELEKQLHLKGDDARIFADDVKRLQKALPDHGSLISFSGGVPVLLLEASIRRQRNRRAEFLRDVAVLRSRLLDLLRVEDQKNPKTQEPESLKGSYGYGSAFINFEKFSTVFPHTASEVMPEDRYRRIRHAVECLGNLEEAFEFDAMIVLAQSMKEESSEWPERLRSCRFLPVEGSSLCVAAERIFDDHMARMSESFKNVRVAKLELAGHYDPEIHDPYFTTFDWRALTQEEMSICPGVLLVTTIEEMMENELTPFSHMLASARPITTVVIQHEARPDRRLRPESPGSTFSFQQELGALAVSHRNTRVIQASTLHPKTLLEGIDRSLAAISPSLITVLSPATSFQRDLSRAYVWTGSVVESRAFPEFSYDQFKGVQFGSRFTIDQNPQANLDWPVSRMDYVGADGQPSSMALAFTYADFASQDAGFERHFLPIPPSCWNDKLIVYSEYLSLESTEAYGKIPFIWMVDQDHQLQKVAVTHFMVLLGQERLDFWHFIQEFGGINSYHVARAVAQAREQFENEKADAIAELTERHRLELEEARRTTAQEAMEKLAAILLDLDSLATIPSAPVPDAKPHRADTKAEAVEAVRTPEPEEEELISAEAWIETIRCTSCNECININPNAFKYDGNKQAVLADATAATFTQLVMAAEKCPAKCIHPGAPLNPNEPGVDDLVKRAAVFG